MVNDTISDMLVRIKNAQAVDRDVIDIPYSKVNAAIIDVIKACGYVSDWEKVTVEKRDALRIKLGDKLFINIKRHSKPGRRLYCSAKNIPRSMGGSGLVIVSTHKGIMSDKLAKKKGLGGEVICEVY